MISARSVTATTRVILFDHDGTLIDSEATHFQLWQEVLAPYQVSISESFYASEMAGIPLSQNARDVIRHFDLDLKPSVLIDAKQSKIRTFLQSQAFPLMPHAEQTVHACAQAGYTLGIVTGGSGLSVQRTLQAYGFADVIKVIVAEEDVEHSKPAPECYLQAARRLNVSPAQCVAVEDTQHGLEAAVRAGMPCVAIPTAQSAKHDFSAATSYYKSLYHWVEAEIG